MNGTEFVVRIEGISPLLYNRKSFMLDQMTDTSLEKQKNEDAMQHNMRVYKEKAHLKDDLVIIPSEWIKRSLAGTQKQTANPIKPANARRKTDTILRNIISGCFVDDTPLNGPVRKDDLEPFKSMVTIPSTKGTILNTRPMIQKWSADITFSIVDEVLDENIIRTLMTWVGVYSGIGEWRPANGGNFGRFMVIK